MNENTYAQWVTDGHGGVVNMWEAIATAPATISKAQHEILKKHIDRLIECYKLLEDKVRDA